MDKALAGLQDMLGYRFRDLSLLQQALRHASAADDASSNERLEFVGDSIVGVAIASELFDSLPEASEGEMTVIKSVVVSRRTLARVGRALELDRHIKVEEGMQTRRYPVSVVAGAYEAVVGAIFLDGGADSARRFVLRTLRSEIEKACADRHAAGYKSILQEKTQAKGRGVPQYEIVRCEGPHHRRLFEVIVRIGGCKCGKGRGATKKEAEQNAAHDALDRRYPGWDSGAQ